MENVIYSTNYANVVSGYTFDLELEPQARSTRKTIAYTDIIFNVEEVTAS